MKLLQPSLPRVVLAVALGLSATAGSGAASRALAFDDKPAWNSVMELVGVGSDERREGIDYRERSKLVVPPNRAALPEPRATEGAPSQGWSLGGANAARPIAAEAPAPVSAPAPGPLEKALAAKDDDSDSECSGAKRQNCWAIVPGRGWVAPAARVGANHAPIQTSRKHLVQPPEAYTTPTKTVTAGADDSGGSSWNPFSVIGKTASKVFSGGGT
jgi:hypothetical protein